MISTNCTARDDSAQKHQAKKVGGPCEGCEAIYEYRNIELSPTDTLSGFAEADHKLKLSGIVYHNDGTTPAKDVIIYIYHTNAEGIYPKRGDETGWGKRHGYIRGWVITDAEGRYTFYTSRPGSYPNSSEPQHIHIIVKEPDVNEYYLDDFLFDDDPKLTKSIRSNRNNRGGNGLVKPLNADGILVVNRDIVLGYNIPEYK